MSKAYDHGKASGYDGLDNSHILHGSKKLDIAKGYANFLAWEEAFAQLVATRQGLSTTYAACKRGFLSKEFLKYYPIFESTTVWLQTANNYSEHFGTSLNEPITVEMLKQQIANQQMPISDHSGVKRRAPGENSTESSNRSKSPRKPQNPQQHSILKGDRRRNIQRATAQRATIKHNVKWHRTSAANKSSNRKQLP
jgi:hypothetical protein